MREREREKHRERGRDSESPDDNKQETTGRENSRTSGARHGLYGRCGRTATHRKPQARRVAGHLAAVAAFTVGAAVQRHNRSHRRSVRLRGAEREGHWRGARSGRAGGRAASGTLAGLSRNPIDPLGKLRVWQAASIEMTLGEPPLQWQAARNFWNPNPLGHFLEAGGRQPLQTSIVVPESASPDKKPQNAS